MWANAFVSSLLFLSYSDRFLYNRDDHTVHTIDTHWTTRRTLGAVIIDRDVFNKLVIVNNVHQLSVMIVGLINVTSAQVPLLSSSVILVSTYTRIFLDFGPLSK